MKFRGRLALNVFQRIWVLIILFRSPWNIGPAGKRSSRKSDRGPAWIEKNRFLLETRPPEVNSKEKLWTFVSLLVKTKNKSSDSVEFLVGNIHIKLTYEEVEAPKIVFDVEFGSQVNPLYYNSLSSSDKCLLLLSRHFQIHQRGIFEEYLSRISNLITERHLYAEKTRYFVEPKRADVKELKLTLDYISAFFSSNLLRREKMISKYLLNLQVDGNQHFMPDNFMKNLFLTVLNDNFRDKSSEMEGFRDIYGEVKECASGIRDRRVFSKDFNHFFRSRPERVEILVNKNFVGLKKMETLVKRSFRRIKVPNSGFNHLKALTRRNPFAALTEGILQVNSNRVTNRMTLLFPVVGEMRGNQSKLVGYIKQIINGSELFKNYCKGQTWVSNLDFDLEYSRENGYSNIMLNLESKWSLNSRERVQKFNLIQTLEVWLQAVNQVSRNTSLGIKGSNGSSSGPSLSEQKLENQLSRYLGVENMVIILYSNEPISIKGTDILKLNSKMKEGKCWYFLRMFYSVLYLIRRDLLPKFGVKYIKQRQDFYFGTKYIYEKLPSSISGYLKGRDT
ncbi:hypothetical protein HWI79_2472 [Cryptosporidium felis]|nr:hypothetical protein HWI79_2472 [Cryptosporidium felis]